jgi:hypothetical protein
VRHQGHVPAYQTPLHRILEGTPDDEMNLQDGLRRQWPPTIGWTQHSLIERLEVVGTQPSYPEMADGGENVPFDLPAVTAPGGLGQVDLLSGQPLASEVGTEGERSSRVVAAVQLGGEPGRQMFGLLSGGAGGKPPASFLAGDRIQPFVHDRIPAVTFTRHIPSHEVLLPWGSDRRNPVEGSVETHRHAGLGLIARAVLSRTPWSRLMSWPQRTLGNSGRTSWTFDIPCSVIDESSDPESGAAGPGWASNWTKPDHGNGGAGPRLPERAASQGATLVRYVSPRDRHRMKARGDKG